MAIGCDGTPIETESHALWTFYDSFRGRMLYVDLLNNADIKTLNKVFQTIKEIYNVPIVAFLSDHQPSIVKGCAEFDPTIPHQTCHFHFLKNHWVFLMEKDTHLNKELRKVVNNLPIGKLDANGGSYYSKDIKIEKNEFFRPLFEYLRKSVNFKDSEFKSLKGMQAYEKLTEIASEISKELEGLDMNLRPTKQLIVTLRELNRVLSKLKSEYENLKELMKHFQEIRKNLGDISIPKEQKIAALDKIYSDLFESYSSQTNYVNRSEIKSLFPKFNMEKGVIICQWCRLWDSHSNNLFVYYDIDGLEKTNIYNERVFSLLKGNIVRAHGRAHKNYMVITQGDVYTTDICDKESVNIKELLTSYNLKEIIKRYQSVQEKIDDERSRFRGSKVLDDSVKDIALKIKDKVWDAKED